MEREHATPQPKPKARKKRTLFYTECSVRRSSRIKKSPIPSKKQTNVQPVVIDITESNRDGAPLGDNLEEPANHDRENVDHAVQHPNTTAPSQNQNFDSESSEEDEPPRLDENLEEPENQGERTLDGKMNQALQLIEKISSKAMNMSSESAEMDDYKTLLDYYLDSQKMNQALIVENHNLSLKLEHALGAMNGFKEGHQASALMANSWMDKFKDVLLAKASEVDVRRRASSSKRKK